ncbi:hypothetical protein BDW59DRAFT_120846 [Aspergillus cavernicola]|uniref:Zn(2)-C6 fungal-type domain-containing protein n=1 Tax=Aspergillus cavernicola TaxID=176166 RepID=A0ABR4HVZ8_9EURO
MARGPGMSKGCAVCRRRKIKCDRKRPNCSQCIRHGCECRGMVQGSIFLGTSLDTPSGRLKNNRLEEPGDNTGETTTGYNQSHFYSSEAALSPTLLPLLLPPGPENSLLLQTQLLSSFHSFFAKSSINKTKSGWMSNLLSNPIQSNSTPHPRWPVLAAALALYSAQHGSNNPRGEEQAREWYGYGLKHQQEILLLSTTPAAEDVSGAILLAYYEVISSTSDEAYFHHILGAQALLVRIGPWACRGSYLHQLLQTVRLHMVYVSLSTMSSSILASELWTSIPFKTMEKSPLDWMVDFLLGFPSTLQYLEKFDLPPAEVEKSTIEVIITLISTWNNTLRSLLNTHKTTPPQLLPDNEEPPLIHTTDLFKYVPRSFPEHDSDSVMTVALYSLGWILILYRKGTLVALNLSDYTPLLVAHCSVILRAAVCMEMFEDGCGYIRMVSPLKYVLIMSPDAIQRDSAECRLRLWARKKGIAGICTVMDLSRDNTFILS